VWSLAKWKEAFKVVTCVSVFFKSSNANDHEWNSRGNNRANVPELLHCVYICQLVTCGLLKVTHSLSPPVVQDAVGIRSTAISAFVTDWTNYLTSNIPFAWKFVSRDFYLVPWGQTVARRAKCRDSHRRDHKQYPLFPGTPSPGRRLLWAIFRQMSFQGHLDKLFHITFFSSSLFFDDVWTKNCYRVLHIEPRNA